MSKRKKWTATVSFSKETNNISIKFAWNGMEPDYATWSAIRMEVQEELSPQIGTIMSKDKQQLISRRIAKILAKHQDNMDVPKPITSDELMFGL